MLISMVKSFRRVNFSRAAMTSAVIGVLALVIVPTAHAQSAAYEAMLTQPEYRTARYFTLGDGAGTSIPDALGGPPGTLFNAPATVAGPMFDTPSGGGALAFDGISQYASIDAPDFADAFNSPEGASVIVWFRAFESSRGAILGTFNNQRNSGFQILLGANAFFYLANEFQLTFTVNFSTGDFVSCSVPTIDWTNGDWHMLAATYRQGVAKLYYDGEPARWLTASQGGTGRLDPFEHSIALGALNDSTINTPKTSQLSNTSLHATELTPAQVRALWRIANGYSSQSVFNAQAVQPWFQAATSERVDAALVGDSNIIFGAENGNAYGHQYGMAQGLRTILPFYAGPVLAGIGTNSWVNATNALGNFLTSAALPAQPPAFIADRVPPSTLGFPTRAFYASESTIIPGSDNFRGSIAWESADFLFDFRREIDWHLTHAQFANGATGIMRPGIRLTNAPFAPLVAASISSAGDHDAIIETALNIPAGPRDPGKTYSLQMTDFANSLGAQGPFALLYHRMVLPEVTAGVSYTPLWAFGGESARHAADIFTNFTTLSQLGEYLHQMVRHQTPGHERLLIQIVEGGNDANDFRPAINADGSTSTLQSQSARGQKLNTTTILSRLRAAWLSRGYDPARLCFLLGPYHPAPTTGPRLSVVYVRGWRELARDLPDYNICVMNAFGFTSIEEFYLGGWYNANGADTAHLARAGYLNFGIKTWQALADAALPGPLFAGACCRGALCTSSSPDTCTGPLALFAGLGTSCSPDPGATTPCCRADFNHDRLLSVQDVFDYLDAFFAADPRADMINSGSQPPTIQSLFAFITAWFAGC